MNEIKISTLQSAAKRRALGYMDAVLSIALPVSDGIVSLTDEQWDTLSKQYRIPSVTHNTVRWRKKGCATCKPIISKTRQSTPIPSPSDHAN